MENPVPQIVTIESVMVENGYNDGNQPIYAISPEEALRQASEPQVEMMQNYYQYNGPEAKWFDPYTTEPIYDGVSAQSLEPFQLGPAELEVIRAGVNRMGIDQFLTLIAVAVRELAKGRTDEEVIRSLDAMVMFQQMMIRGEADSEKLRDVLGEAEFERLKCLVTS